MAPSRPTASRPSLSEGRTCSATNASTCRGGGVGGCVGTHAGGRQGQHAGRGLQGCCCVSSTVCLALIGSLAYQENTTEGPSAGRGCMAHGASQRSKTSFG